MEKKISSKKNEAKLKDENTWSMALNSDEIKELKRIKNTRKIYDIIIKEAEDHAIKTYGKYYYDDEKRKPFLNYQKTKSGAKKEWMIRGFLEELKKQNHQSIKKKIDILSIFKTTIYVVYISCNSVYEKKY